MIPAPLTLLCLPFAGGSARFFLPWQRLAPAWLKIVPVELPGHGAQLGEGLLEHIDEVVAQLGRIWQPQLPQRYAIFGHSLGALTGFALAHALMQQGAAAPQALLVSSTSAPGYRDEARYRQLAVATPPELKNELQRLGGTSADLLENDELMAMMLPVLAADFRVCASFDGWPLPPALPCPLFAFGGRQDTSVTQAGLEGWQHQTQGGFAVEWFEGGHFYLQQHAEDVISRIARLLSHHDTRQVAGELSC